jgi:hypothetical protein
MEICIFWCWKGGGVSFGNEEKRTHNSGGKKTFITSAGILDFWFYI